MQLATTEAIPRPEYPRPTLVRGTWLNLNGEWEFAFDDAEVGLTEQWFDGRELPLRITVPFAYQAPLSGIGSRDVHEVVWYARTVEIPAEWQVEDLLLHFGAVDYRTTVWVNGDEVGHNQGGHVPFSFNIAPYLKPDGNRIVIRVEDRQDPMQPRGKQSSRADGTSHGIYYTCTTGIWQTVWLEPVPKLRIESLHITPLFVRDAVEVRVYLHAPASRWRLQVLVKNGNRVVASIDQQTLTAVSRIELDIPDPVYWCPEEPHLYDVEITLSKDDQILDTVRSYFGLRSIAVIDGKLSLNGIPTYLKMALDQGYWEGGGLTAPTDDDLRKDIELMKQMGFNGARKHQKMEDPRWLYWCDRLGLLVWGEMASAHEWTPRSEEWVLQEWERAVRRDYNHACVIAWVPANESWGLPGSGAQHPGHYAYIDRIVAITRRLDHFRPVIDNDGWEHTDIGDVLAIHDYTQTSEGLWERYKDVEKTGQLPEETWVPGIPMFEKTAKYHGQPVMLTEVGGFLEITPDLAPEKRDLLYTQYGTFEGADDLLAKYAELMFGIRRLTFLAGFCYTQLTDVEQEANGLLRIDRTSKVPVEQLAALHAKFHEQPGTCNPKKKK
jgi:beta-galactosidase/beta-glucuronidase